MKRIPVCFKDSHYEIVSTDKLDKLLESRKIKAFRRTAGWVIIGQDPVRSKDGKYNGPERRMERKRQCCRGIKHRMSNLRAQKERQCLTCINMIDGKCVVTAIKVRY
jgi:hypothetical protein